MISLINSTVESGENKLILQFERADGDAYTLECTRQEVIDTTMAFWLMNMPEDVPFTTEELADGYVLTNEDLLLFAYLHEAYSKAVPRADAPIRFITTRSDHWVNDKDILVSNDIYTAVKECRDYIQNIPTPVLDIEASDIVAQYANVLLIAIGDKHRQWIFDSTSVPISCLAPIEDLNKQWLGHNIKYDCNVLSYNGFKIRKCWDTMIAEQTLRRGSLAGNGLADTITRRLGLYHDIGKDTRDDFIGQSKAMVFNTRHVKYAATDIKYLEDIKEVQTEYAKEFQLLDWLENYEFPLIPVISETELEGLWLDKEKWRGIVADNRARFRAYELEADKEVEKLLADAGKKELLAGKYTRKRRSVDIIQTSLFGDDKITQNKCAGNVSYGSEQQVKALFRTLGEEPPVKKDKGVFKESVGKEALEEWLVERPFHRLTKLIKILIQLADLRTKISSFGENYIKSINVKTGKIHTIYKTATTDTGRFSSGDMKFGLFNSQNVPKLKSYRQCFFTDPGFDMVTCDLSGAELIILASMAQDKKLIGLALGDIHSYLATACYKNLCGYYAKEAGKQKKDVGEVLRDLIDGLKPDEKCTDEQIAALVANPRSIVISKENLKWVRDAFKSVVYGIAYGASNIRIAKVLNIDKVAAQNVLDTIAMELPVTMEYLSRAAQFGLYAGYIEFHPRSHCRRWFETVIDHAKAGMQLPFGLKGDVERACKNSPIQGTQACMIKEAIVDIANYIKEHNLDAKMLLAVHDELVYKYPKYLNEEVLPLNGGLHSFPEIVKLLMCQAADRYLTGVTMGAEYHVEETWTK